MTRLTQAQRYELVRRYDAGEKVDALAAEYDVSREYPSKLSHRYGSDRRKIINRKEKSNGRDA